MVMKKRRAGLLFSSVAVVGARGLGATSAAADTTGSLTGTVNLPPATGSFSELGLVPVTATIAFVEQGQTTGTLESDGGIQAPRTSR